MSEIRADKLHNASGDNDSGIDLSTNDKVAIKIADAEVTTVDTTGVVFNDGSADRDFRVESDGQTHAIFLQGSDGNIGVNESSPDTKLHVSNNASGTPLATFENTASHEGTIRFKTGHSSNSDYKIGASISASNNFEIYSVGASTHRLAIDSDGEVGINQLAPSAQLHVKSDNMASTRDALRLQNGTNNTGGYFIRFINHSAGTAGYVEQTGSTAVAYRTSSDYRLKENVVAMSGAIDRVKQLLPKRFNWIADGTDTVVDGFLAHEAQTVVPESVGGTHNEVDEDGNPVYQGIDQSKLVPLLTGALKEAIAKIEALETRIEALENA